MIVQCKFCKKKPHELEEYVDAAESCKMTPEQYVRREEGTFNRETGFFACTPCYIEIGMPASPTGWVA